MAKRMLLLAVAMAALARAQAPTPIPPPSPWKRASGVISPRKASDTVAIRTTLLTNSDYDNGTCVAAKTINYSNGYNQKVTLTAGQTCALTFTQPVGNTAHVQLLVIQAGGAANGAISGGKWPGGATPPITATAGAEDIVTCKLNGADAKCVASADFK